MKIICTIVIYTLAWCHMEEHVGEYIELEHLSEHLTYDFDSSNDKPEMRKSVGVPMPEGPPLIPYIGVMSTSCMKCTVCLIDSYWAITTAGCVINCQEKDIIVVFGISRIDGSDAVKVKADKLIVHPEYKSTIEHDIALIHFQTPVPLSENVKIVSYDTHYWDPSETRDCFITGFNNNFETFQLDILAGRGDKHCNKCLPEESFICVSTFPNENECIEESVSGAVICSDHLVGIRHGDVSRVCQSDQLLQEVPANSEGVIVKKRETNEDAVGDDSASITSSENVVIEENLPSEEGQSSSSVDSNEVTANVVDDLPNENKIEDVNATGKHCVAQSKVVVYTYLNGYNRWIESELMAESPGELPVADINEYIERLIEEERGGYKNERYPDHNQLHNDHNSLAFTSSVSNFNLLGTLLLAVGLQFI